MKMKLFYAGNKNQIIDMELQVNSFLEKLPATSKIFAVNTASTDHGPATGVRPTSVTITIWYSP
jgi:hypothetical protein